MMEERKDGFLYDPAGNQVGYHGKVSKSKPQNFSFLLIILLGFALYQNASKWGLAFTNYWGNILHHPIQLFHFEPILYLFMIVLGLAIAARRFSK